jgi:hypothetical protein
MLFSYLTRGEEYEKKKCLKTFRKIKASFWPIKNARRPLMNLVDASHFLIDTITIGKKKIQNDQKSFNNSGNDASCDTLI